MAAIRDHQGPTVAPPEAAAEYGSRDLAVKVSRSQVSPAPATIICPDVESIPSGRQPTAIPQCGICMKSRLYSRNADLKRHMEIQQPGTHFYHVNGCPRGPGNGFTRVDRLHEHLKNKHGL
ncbi:hypothetical protein CERZMDRAFT_96083 [Cercospora zeae-maydis SCOH1-5]|uniref:C2H2-type domain-containing protein n=1 Tax=Cercospora zeae-maydis SCOH1-5 TaxID=717836 RepID=A0A6A6FKT3_9PEZI|nr:hypothetical protein CERZMDRAFT_96083 [Cercospora zeae-maydis SCOH1-5]